MIADRIVPRPLGWFDTALVVVFLLGLYLGVALPITSTIPLPCAPSGFAGLILLWRRRDQIEPAHLGGLLVVITLYLGSIVSASNVELLGKRFTGFVQLSYSLVIGYALFITLIHAERRQIARILMFFCVAIAIGVPLEQYTPLRDISDQVRQRIYESNIVYDADLRDQVLYGRVRPKLFTSEPSNVTFGYTLFGFFWFVVSPWRWKLPAYGVLIAVGFAVMRGPTLLLMVVLAVPYLLFLGGNRDGRSGSSALRVIGIVAVSAVLAVATIMIGSSLYAERLQIFMTGRDASTFSRVIGPMLVAFDTFKHYPWAGAGLTGEQLIEASAMNIYMASGTYESSWYFKISESLTNFFWLHWIYLGMVWGTIMIIALSIWLRLLQTPSLLFCWSVWIVFGQAAGAYVGPKTWCVLLMAAAGGVLTCQREKRAAVTAREAVAPRLPELVSMMAHRRERFG